MSLTSRTGLVASPVKKITRKEQVETVQLKAFTRKAPFILKPFGGLYNPYSHGCSLLCNHPTDHQSREILKKAKTSWANETKNLLLPEEIEAIRAEFETFNTKTKNILTNHQIESVPEELFRRYTDTDSRPLTPAPTLASAATRASGSRRCVTPDPLPSNQIREKTLLVLDLRRSHSQETLTYYGSSSLQEPPIIRIDKAPSVSHAASPQIKHSRSTTPSPIKTPNSPKKKPHKEQSELEIDKDDEDDEFIKRRGKRRRKKRGGSGGAPAVQNSVDPETQVATIGPESRNASGRGSLVPQTPAEDALEERYRNKNSARSVLHKWETDSYLDFEILRQLRRELNEEVIDNEFDLKRRKALEEALKTIPKDRQQCDALIELQKELNVPPVNADLWISFPRIFSRANARFELPLDNRTLSTLTPLDYIKNYVFIQSSLKLLYNCIFNKFKIETDSVNSSHQRQIQGQQILEALDLVMGRPLNDAQKSRIHALIGWRDDHVYDFKTFAAICALCERMLAPEFSAQMPDRAKDPPHEIETADFQALARKLNGQEVDCRLVEILKGIKNL